MPGFHFTQPSTPMIALPQKRTLELQTAEILRGQIDQGAWKAWLPAERALCEMLQVSRITVRAALGQLRRDGVIAAEERVGNKIIRRRKNASGAGSDVALLVSSELHHLLPSIILWVDQLRAMLAARGSHLHLFSGQNYARRNPAPALKKLVRQHPHPCWILLSVNRDVQAWFQKNAIPCVVAGSVHEGIELPGCDVDYRAACRHAASLFLRRGHRRIALLAKHSRAAGDICSEAGFSEAFTHPGFADAAPVICHCDDTAEGAAKAVRQMMVRKSPPTALLVLTPFHCLTVISCLSQLGYNVPRDVSVISRYSETFHDYLLPRPSGYTIKTRLYARTLLRMIAPALNGSLPAARVRYIMPEFLEGNTVSSPPARA